VSNRPIENSKRLRSRIISGSAVLLSGSSLTTAINLGYNIAVARFLGASGYGHVAVLYTMLTIASAVTLSFQIVSAKVVAQPGSEESRTAAYRFLHRSAWSCGLFAACLLVVFRQPVAEYLRLPSPLLVVLLACGVAFYVPLGSRRGYILGACGFRRLASNLVLEAGMRLIGSLVAVFLGFGVTGVIGANAAAEAIAWLVIAPARTASGRNPLAGVLAARELLQALVFFSGQVLINNSDIVLVKHFFAPATAGLYAAIALVGRVIFSFSSAIMNGMFPVVAGARHEERRNLSLIATSMLLVLGIGSAMALGLRLAPPWIWTTFFGAGFRIPGPHGMPYLLSLKAVVTMVFSLSIIVIAYEMSYRIANTAWVQVAFAGAVIAGICRFHSSLREVLLVQLLLMLLLLVVVAVPFLLSTLRHGGAAAHDASPAIRLIRHVSEDEVIAEFLRSDFDHDAYGEYHESMRSLVQEPNLDSPSECAKRRALLFVRHLALWKEIPANTEWYEVEIGETGLDRVQVFPRAQWRKIARGNLRVRDVAEKLAGQLTQDTADPFSRKIEAFRRRLGRPESLPGAVVLIGLNEQEALTIIDGNHRLVAALLEGRVRQLRVLCGLSPNMNQCCWYRTNLVTLSRYGTNRVLHLTYHPEAELDRLFERSGQIL
jgi:O-antigen/teichoic acid export membrane protein